jgi:hypothetical protein
MAYLVHNEVLKSKGVMRVLLHTFGRQRGSGYELEQPQNRMEHRGDHLTTASEDHLASGPRFDDNVHSGRVYRCLAWDCYISDLKLRMIVSENC